MIRSGYSLLSCATKVLSTPNTKQVLTSPAITSSLLRRKPISSINPSLLNVQINKHFSTNNKYTYNGAKFKPLYLTVIPLLFGIASVAACEEEKKPSPISTGYTFEAGVSVIPHPEKVYKGGEDAYFISDDAKVLGVADGVGGWSKHGVDPALYSKALMEGAKEGTKDPEINRNPVKIMRRGYDAAKEIRGSSTCCIVLLDTGVLKTANLGDSGFMVVRQGTVIYRSKEQQHRFNFPFQLGGKTSHSEDLPEHSNIESIKIASGDIVILGSDGLWDNLYDDQIVQLVKKTTDPNKLATLVAQTASEFAHKREGSSPFSDGNYKANKIRRPGGKVDDITVLVGRVREGSSKSSDDEDDKIMSGVLGKLWAKL